MSDQEMNKKIEYLFEIIMKVLDQIPLDFSGYTDYSLYESDEVEVFILDNKFHAVIRCEKYETTKHCDLIDHLISEARFEEKSVVEGCLSTECYEAAKAVEDLVTSLKRERLENVISSNQKV
jgi:hypothetical protein